MRKNLFALMLAGLGLAGCNSTGSLPRIHSIDVNAVSAVQAEIKRQVGVYVRTANADRAARNAANHRVQDPHDYWCGSGALDFEITSVKIDLLTSRDRTTKANAGLKIPISAFTLNPSLSHSYEATDLEELVYNEWLVSGGETPAAEDPKKPARVAEILLALRKGLIDASRKSTSPNGPQSCFAAYNTIAGKAGDDPGDSIKIAFTAVDDTTGGVALDVGIVSAGVSQEVKGTASSTMTVSFREVGSAKFKECAGKPGVICDPNGVHPPADLYRLQIPPLNVFPNGELPAPPPGPPPAPGDKPVGQ